MAVSKANVSDALIGRWSVTHHYYLTKFALQDYGFSGNQLDLLCHYSSVYADNPGGALFGNNLVHWSSKQMDYREDIDYSETNNSQATSWRPGSKSYNYNIWHSRRSPEEAAANSISENDAMERGMQFGWDQIFASAKEGKLSDLKKNSKGIKAWGQSVHALQDAYARKGVDINHHNVRKDVFPSLGEEWSSDYENAGQVTRYAINVHNLISCNFAAVKTNEDGNLELRIEGMTENQFRELLSRVQEYIDYNKSKNKK